MKLKTKVVLFAQTALFAVPLQSIAEDGQFFVKPYFGFSSLSDTDGSVSGPGLANGNINVEVDDGYVTGLGFGYRYNANIASEVALEYRTNDVASKLSNGEAFDEGDYSSLTLYVNGYYFFDANSAWTPYLGAGIGWVEEIDIDLERGGFEQSLSGDETAFQVMAGVAYQISDAWNLNAELRYSSVSGVDVDGEDFDAEITGLDYDPLTLQVGFSYSF